MGRTILTVPVDDVVPKTQIRKVFRNIDELAHSMITEGQQSPITVSPRNQNGKYVIQKGERRWRACKEAKIETIDIVVNERIQSKVDETAGELIENIQRDNLTAMEIAHGLQVFIEQNWKQVDIAERLGKSAKFVSSHLGLLKLPACVSALYDQGECTDADTLNNLRQLHEIDLKRCRKLCDEAVNKGISRQRSREELNRAREWSGQPRMRSLGIPSSTKIPARSSPGISRPGRSKDYITEKNVHPAKVTIVVTVKKMKGATRGILVTDRASPHSGFVWVRTVNEHGVEETYCVRAADVELVRIEI